MLFLVEFVPITHPWDVVMGWFRIIHILTSLPSVAGHNCPFFAPSRTARRCWNRVLLHSHHLYLYACRKFTGISKCARSCALKYKKSKQSESSGVSCQIHTAQILANL